MTSCYIGEVRAVGFNFAPPGWVACNGQSLSVNDYQTLFYLIGTTYGGDGQTSFNVPNLNGAVIVGAGQGPGLSNYPLGQHGGSAAVLLTTTNMPPHTHSFSAPLMASTSGTATDTPTNALPGQLGNAYGQSPAPDLALNPSALQGMTSVAGGSTPHSNLQPSQSINYIIAVEGSFPPQP